MSEEPSSSVSPGLAVRGQSFMERFRKQNRWRRDRGISLFMLAVDYCWYGWTPDSYSFGRASGSLFVDFVCLLVVSPLIPFRIAYDLWYRFWYGE